MLHTKKGANMSTTETHTFREILPAKTFDALYWKRVDGAQLDSLLTGLECIGAEPVDYPATDGALLYFRKKDGGTLALLLEHDFLRRDDPEATDLEISMAEA